MFTAITYQPNNNPEIFTATLAPSIKQSKDNADDIVITIGTKGNLAI